MSYAYGVSAFASGTGTSTDPLNIGFYTQIDGAWEAVAVDASVPRSGAYQVVVANNGATFLVVVHYGSTAIVYQSTDSGTTWAEIVTDLLLGVGTLSAFYCLNGTWALVFHTASGIDLHISADGLTWTARTGPRGAWQAPVPSNIFADANDRLHVTAGAYSSTSHFYTDDLGVTWSTPTTLFGFAAIYWGLVGSGETLVFVGLDNFVSSAIPYLYQAISFDSGETWDTETYLNTGLFSLADWGWWGDGFSYASLPLLIVGDSLYLLAGAEAGGGGFPYVYASGMLESTNWTTGLPDWTKKFSTSGTEFLSWRTASVSAPMAPDSYVGAIVLGGPILYPDPILDPVDTRIVADVSLTDGALTTINALTGTGDYYGFAPAGGGEYAGNHSLHFGFYRIGGPNVNVYLF